MNTRGKGFGSECVLQGGFEEQWWRVFCNCMIVPDVVTPEPLSRAYIAPLFLTLCGFFVSAICTISRSL